MAVHMSRRLLINDATLSKDDGVGGGIQVNKAMNKAADIAVIVCPWFFTLKIILCALGVSQIDWWDALFILAYTFIVREVRKDI